MTHHLGTGDLERLLARTARAVEAVRARPGEPAEGTGAAGGEGFDADGWVRVVVDRGARVDAVEISQRAIRSGSRGLADRVIAAVNAALADLENNVTRAAPPAGPPAGQATRTAAGSAGGTTPAELGEELREVQDQSLEQLRSYTRSLQDMMNSFGRG